MRIPLQGVTHSRSLFRKDDLGRSVDSRGRLALRKLSRASLVGDTHLGIIKSLIIFTLACSNLVKAAHELILQED